MAGDRLLDRRVKIIVASSVSEDFGGGPNFTGQVVEIDNLRVQFEVTKSLKRSANTAEVRVWNLAERTRSSLQNKGAKLSVSAGYASTLGQLFFGDVRFIDHVREGAEWVTKIESGDGERGMGAARVNVSFGAGTPIADVANVLGKKLGFDISDMGKKLTGKNKQFVNGYSAYGPAARELDRVLAAAGFEWSVQDGRIQVLERGGVSTERVIVLSAESGLIGSPEHGTAGRPTGKKTGKGARTKQPILKVRSLLMPDLRPGGRVQLESIKHNGLYRVLKVKHTGDTAGNDWYSDCELEVA